MNQIGPLLVFQQSFISPRLHDQIFHFFHTIFLHQSCERLRKSMTHCCGHQSSIKLNIPYENENQCLKSPVEFLRGNRIELYLPASFQKAAVLNEGNLAFSRAFENIEPENTKTAPRSTQKTNASQLLSENVIRNFTSFDLIGNDVL